MDTKHTPKLLPCPFCGACAPNAPPKEISHAPDVKYGYPNLEDRWEYWVSCGLCHAKSSVHTSSEDAFKAWNTRAPETAAERDRLRELNAEMLAALRLVSLTCGGHENWQGETRNFLMAAEDVLAKAEPKP